MVALRAWIKQPTTVAGISALLGTLTGVVLQQIGWAQAAPLCVGAIVSIILPDNTTAKAQAETLVDDIVAGITVRKDVK